LFSFHQELHIFFLFSRVNPCLLLKPFSLVLQAELTIVVDEHLWSFYAENLYLFRQDLKNCAIFNIQAGFLSLKWGL